MSNPVLHIPLDFERREDLRRFQRAVGELAPTYVFRMWVDWGTAGVEFRKVREPAGAEPIEWEKHELTFIIEEFCGWKAKPGELIEKAITAGVLRLEKRDGVDGLVLEGFWKYNHHLAPGFKTIQERGAIAMHAKRTAATIKDDAATQVAIMGERGAQFSLPLDARPTTDEVTRCVTLVRLIDRACNRPQRPQKEFTTNEQLMVTALQIVRRYSQEEVEQVYEYIIANRENPRLGKIPDRILEHFGQHLEKSKSDGGRPN